jgi:bud site selection protein 20
MQVRLILCLARSRHFVNVASLQEHVKSKVHKKRVKLLKEEPYLQKEAEVAVGLQTENQRNFKPIETTDAAASLMDVFG